jgi:hypothetical protein
MNIWHIANKELTSLILWRTDNSNFRLTQRGDYNPLLTNSDYTLIDKKYSTAFKHLSDQVTLQDAKIQDLNLKTENDNYTELKIQNSIDPNTINTKDSSGLKIWVYNGNVFVSGDLKTELLKISDIDLDFSLGFSHFG